MIFPKSFNDETGENVGTKRNRGVILVDILLALSVSILFVSLMTQLTYGARDLFDRAQLRSELIDVYAAHADDFADLKAYQSRTITALTGESIVGRARPYGNERTEITVEVIPKNEADSLKFVSVGFNEPGAAPSLWGASLCSADFTRKEVVGSYRYLTSIVTPQPGLYASTMKMDIINLPISATLPLTDLVVRNGLALISSDSASSGDPDLFVVDISSSTDPIIRSSLNTGPGIVAITVIGDHIFAAAASTASQLHVVRMNSPDFLVLEKKYQLPLPYATATPTVGSSIFSDSSRVYFGTEKWDGTEFNIFDAVTPHDPILIGSLEVGSKVNELYAHSRVYAATAGKNQLMVIDISSTTVPSILTTVSPSGWQRQEGKSISYFEDKLRFGRTSGGFNIVTDHELFGWGTTTVQSTNLSQPVSFDLSGGVYGVVSDRRYEYVISRQLGKELYIFDAAFSTTTPVSISLPSPPLTMVCNGDSLYVLSKTSPTLYKINW
jgi:hypothetical protein